jgi:hypothetical protein
MSESAQLLFNTLNNAAAVTALVGRPEDLYLEAKTCTVPFNDSDKNKLAKVLSGFANADGGVLVYGLVAKGGDLDAPDRITKVDPVRKLDLALSQALSLVGQLVDPPVPGVVVEPRRLAGRNEGFLVLLVPRSDGFLHRSRRDREYYRRHGHGFYAMEHYEIAEFYGRRKSPQLRPWWQVHVPQTAGVFPDRAFTVHLVLGVKNEGRGIAKYPAMRIKSQQLVNLGSGPGSMVHTQSVNPTWYQGGGDCVVYPGATKEVAMIRDGISISEKQPEGPEIHVAYELYAEDMEAASGTLVITRQEVLRRIREKG